jgi:tRNA threonylcarbamoyladenosine biosynthesis protein TsaB
VAVSLVQGLAWAREIPVVPICSLWAQVISAEAAGLLEGVETCVSTIDAKISQFYQATFTRHGNSWRVTSQPQLTSSFEEVEQGGSIQCVIGSGLLVTAKDVPVIQLGSADLFEPDRASRAAVEPNMAAVLAHMVNGGELPAPMAPEDLEPAYVHTEIGWKKIGEQGR